MHLRTEEGNEFGRMWEEDVSARFAALLLGRLKRTVTGMRTDHPQSEV
jgi:hypothetical protein